MKQQYKFEIIHKDWTKRRKSTAQAKPLSVSIPNFKLLEQHFCNMEVEYDDGTIETYYSRVLKNHITGQWTVDGMHVAVKVLID